MHVMDVVNWTFSRARHRVLVEIERNARELVVFLPLLYMTVYIVHSGMSSVRELSFVGFGE